LKLKSNVLQMSTAKTVAVALPLKAKIAVYNEECTLVAVTDGKRIGVRSCRPEQPSLVSDQSPVWEAECSESTASRVSAMCWMKSEFGQVLCCGTDHGSVMVYARSPRTKEFVLRTTLRYSLASVTCLQAAPRRMSVQGGPVVAAGYKDGHIRLYEGCQKRYVNGGEKKEVMLESVGEWEMHSSILPRSQDAGACTCMSWKPEELDDAEMPPVIVAGFEGQSPDLYMYKPSVFKWQWTGKLGSDTFSDHYNTELGVSSISWAPILGRPKDLIAVASGPVVTLWSLEGPLDAMEIETVANLEHEAHVFQVGWNMVGNWLAVSTRAGEICMWRPDLAGEWIMCNKICQKGKSANDLTPSVL